LAAELTKNDNRITGIDILPKSEVLPALARYYQADLCESISHIIEDLRGETFDRVLFLDVLEHLTTCDRLLRECRPAVKDTGFLIVSVPNIANIYVRLLLLLGKFEYTERGILDKTHARFFTRETARAFLRENGYAVVEERWTCIPIELIVGLSPANPIMRFATAVLGVLTRMMPGLMGYQIVFLARAA